MDWSRFHQGSSGSDLLNLLPTEILIQILSDLDFDERSALQAHAIYELANQLKLMGI